MGSGSFSTRDFASYSCSTGKSFDYSTGKLYKSTSHQDIFKSSSLDPALDPKNVIRECLDSPEHPETKPVILALDVTGSMSDAALETASSLNKIMTNLFGKVKDIEFLTMGIGDFAYDRCPLQVSQFESDIRIAEQMDKIYFEFGGGGNSYESYTAAWKFGLNNTKLDCYDKRGKKALLITMGDERINPYIDATRWYKVVGESCQAIDTKRIYKEASKKFEIYHIHVDHHAYGYEDSADSFKEVLPEQHVITCKVEEIDNAITNIILDFYQNQEPIKVKTVETSEDSTPTEESTNNESVPNNVVNEFGVELNENGEIVW